MRDDYRIIKKDVGIIVFFNPKIYNIRIKDYEEFEKNLLEEIHYSAIFNSNLSVGIVTILINPLKAHYYTEAVISENLKNFLSRHRLEEVF